MQFAEQYCFSGDDPFMASTTVSYSHTRKGRTKQVPLPKQGKTFSIMQKHSSCTSQYVLTKCVRCLGWGWCHGDDLLNVCVPVFPVYFLSFPFLQPQQGYTVCTSWQQNWWWWGSQVPHGKANPQSLVGCPDGVASAGAPDWYLWAQAAVGSQGAPPCIHCSCVIWLHQLRFLLKPLRSEEAFTSTLGSSWAWELAAHLLPPAWLQRGSFVESQSAQCRDGQRGHRSMCHRNIWSPERPKALVLLMLP